MCDINDIGGFVNGQKYNLVGDVLEFGTFTGGSTKTLSRSFPNKKIYTIDHFQGLEKTNKNIPKNSDWIERAFAIDNPLYTGNPNVPKSIEELKKRFEGHNNIIMIVEDIHKLKKPSDYGIEKIAICNIDVDIYEPTVSALEFLSKCVWNEVFIRFDDWHGGESEYDNHERLAFREWVNKYGYQHKITHNSAMGGAYVKK